MLKFIGMLLAGIVCVSCGSHQENTLWRTAFEEYQMSPYYLQNMEEMENIPLRVQGEIPHWLHGEFVRNGPGIIQGRNGPLRSWFDGLAKLHGFKIDHGEVAYTCKFLESTAYKKFQATGDLDFVGFAQQPRTDPFSLIDFLLGVKNKDVTNANVTISKINNQWIGLTEIPLPVAFDEDVNTLGPLDYQDNLTKNYSFESAHILEDPNTKEMWNFLIKIGLFNAEYQIYRIPYGSCTRKLITSIPVSSVSYMHSFSLAGRYFVLVDYPLRAKNPQALAHGFIEAFSWFPNEPTLIYVIDRTCGGVLNFSLPPFFSFHHINGFEKDGKIFIDLIAYPTPDIIYKVNTYPFVKNPDNKVWRLELDLVNQTSRMNEKTSESLEFPRLNESFIGKEYHYFYAVHIRPNGNGIMKYNHLEPHHVYWFQEGYYANEPVFVSHPYALSEDDGVILTIVNDLNNDKSFLLILDAKNLRELARMETPNFVPFGFHGQFFKK